MIASIILAAAASAIILSKGEDTIRKVEEPTCPVRIDLDGVFTKPYNEVLLGELLNTISDDGENTNEEHTKLSDTLCIPLIILKRMFKHITSKE